MKLDEKLEDGLYLVRDGNLVKLDPPDDDTKGIRLPLSTYTKVRRLQRRLRKRCWGYYKPNIADVVDALVLQLVDERGIEGTLASYFAQ